MLSKLQHRSVRQHVPLHRLQVALFDASKDRAPHREKIRSLLKPSLRSQVQRGSAIAVVRGMVRTMKMLVGYGADLDAADNEGRRAVHFALIYKQESAALFLIRKNCNSEDPDHHA